MSVSFRDQVILISLVPFPALLQFHLSGLSLCWEVFYRNTLILVLLVVSSEILEEEI